MFIIDILKKIFSKQNHGAKTKQTNKINLNPTTPILFLDTSLATFKLRCNLIDTDNTLLICTLFEVKFAFCI